MMNEKLLQTYSTTLDLNPKRCSDRNQFVYGSQLYDTFFCVFAVFETALNGEKIILKSATFNVLNYKGPINIGIVGAEFEDGKIHLFIKALSNPDEQKTLVFPENTALEQNEQLVFERNLLPMSNDNQPYKGQNFDSEFYVRDGKNHTRRQQQIEKEISLLAISPRCIRSITHVTF